VVGRVPVEQVCPRRGGGAVPVDRPGAGGGLVGQGGEKTDGAAPHVGELVDQIGERPLVEGRAVHVRVFVHRRQRLRVAAGDAEGAVQEDALGVGDVPDDLPGAPLAVGVAKPCAVFRNVGEVGGERLALVGQQRNQVVGAGNEREVAVEIGGVIAGLRARERGHQVCCRACPVCLIRPSDLILPRYDLFHNRPSYATIDPCMIMLSIVPIVIILIICLSDFFIDIYNFSCTASLVYGFDISSMTFVIIER